MSVERVSFSAPHPACGTVVETRLPNGYPLSEGVGLFCPVCQAAFWHTPDGDSAEPQPAATAPVSTAPARHAFLPPLAAEPEPEPRADAEPEPPPVAVDALGVELTDRVLEERAEARRRAQRRAAVETVIEEGEARTSRAFVIAAVVVGLAAVVALGVWFARLDQRTPATVAPVGPTSVPAVTPAGLTPVATAGAEFEFRKPDGWDTTATAAGDTRITSPRGAGTITISARPRRGRTLARLGADARDGLSRQLPGHRVSAPERIQLNGRSAIRVSARRGNDIRELTLFAVREERLLVAVNLERDATGAIRSAASEAVASLTIR